MPLKPNMGIKAYIKDFQKSDAPQFKGKSKEQRRDQAVAAYLQAKDDMKEGTVKRVTQVSLDQAKRDLKMKKIQKKMKSLEEISVAKRNKYYDDAKKSIDRAKSSAVGKILRGKEADGTRHDHSIELRTMARREKGIKTAKNQAIKNIRGELYKKKTNEMTMGQGMMVKKVPAGNPAPTGYKVKKLAKIHGGKFDVYHKETDKVKDAKAGRTMYNDTTTKESSRMNKKTDEGYIKSDKIHPHPQANLTKVQRRALTALDKRAKKPVTLPGMDMFNKKEKEPTKVGRQSQVVRYEEKGRGPTGIAYSLPKGHPDAENPATRKKYPERQTAKYKKDFAKNSPIKLSGRFSTNENAFRPPHMTKKNVDHQKAKKLMSPAKHRDDGINRIMKGMNVDKNKATKMHDDVMKSYGFKPESVNEVSMKTLGSYIKKRQHDVAAAGSQMTGDYGIGPAEKKAKRRQGVDDYVKATRNISKAVDKMTGKAKVPATNEEMNSYMASTRSMQGVVHARDEDHAREIMRTKHGAKGKIDLRLKGPVSKTTRERRPLGPQESTWYMPTGKELIVLRNMMKRPIILGENAENAIDNIPIGSDNLHRIFVAEAKKDPNTDARTMIENWLNDRLKHGDEEAEYLGIRLGLLEGYEADVSKFMNKHDIDHHWSGGKLHVDQKDEKRAMKKLSKKYGGYGPRGAKMMPQVHVKK